MNARLKDALPVQAQTQFPSMGGQPRSSVHRLCCGTKSASCGADIARTTLWIFPPERTTRSAEEASHPSSLDPCVDSFEVVPRVRWCEGCGDEVPTLRVILVLHHPSQPRAWHLTSGGSVSIRPYPPEPRPRQCLCSQPLYLVAGARRRQCRDQGSRSC